MIDLFDKITSDKRNVFSRNAAADPVKPIIKIIDPIHINRKAGSSIKLLDLFKLLKTSFSFIE